MNDSFSKSPELLNAFDAKGNIIKVEERKCLLDEIQENSYRTGDAHLAVEAIYLILFNSAGELLIVQRGDKPENPWLWDKTVGGHVKAGETFDATLYREAINGGKRI